MENYDALIKAFGEKFGELLDLGNQIAEYGITINYHIGTRSDTSFEDERNKIHKAIDEQFEDRKMFHSTTYNSRGM